MMGMIKTVGLIVSRCVIDRFLWWSFLPRILGWSVSQEFQVMSRDHQGCVFQWVTGMPTRKDAERCCDAERYCGKSLWVRRVVEIWKD